MTITGVDTWKQAWLPQKPYATNDFLEGLRRHSRPVAMDKVYVEANPLALSNLLVVDIDHADALLRAQWHHHGWLPNAIIENPANGHAHAIWALSQPIARTEYARRKPLAYAAAVAEGLRRSVDGDKGYSGLMIKNPLHTQWDTYWTAGKLYTLDELASHLSNNGFMPAPGWKQTRRKNPVGLGRNCALFESARTWAYREIRHHFGDPDGLLEAITSHAHLLNQEFSEPLPYSETSTIARSIHKWIVTQSNMWADGAVVYEANFINIQSARGRKGGRASGVARREKADHFWKENS